MSIFGSLRFWSDHYGSSLNGIGSFWVGVFSVHARIWVLLECGSGYLGCFGSRLVHPILGAGSNMGPSRSIQVLNLGSVLPGLPIVPKKEKKKWSLPTPIFIENSVYKEFEERKL